MIISINEDLVGYLLDLAISNSFLKLFIWQKLFLASSVGLGLRSCFDECDSILLMMYSKYSLIMALWRL